MTNECVFSVKITNLYSLWQEIRNKDDLTSHMSLDHMGSNTSGPVWAPAPPALLLSLLGGIWECEAQPGGEQPQSTGPGPANLGPVGLSFLSVGLQSARQTGQTSG